MLYLILSILCNITVGILLKLAKRRNIDILQIIAYNYLFAILLCYFVFNPDVTAVMNWDAPWSIYSALGILLPTIFLILAISIKHIGIVKTDISQRLSLFIPLLAAYFIFKEDFTALKLAGLIVGFVAIFFTLSKKKQGDISSNKWIYPIIVFVGFGIIDVLFKQIATYTAVPYTTSLFAVFCCSLIIALGIVLYQLVMHKSKLESKNFLYGGILGLFNFGNILFYLKAHKAFAENPSTVFAAMNLGVIILASLVGIVFFKEKMNTKNYIGIGLALIAITLITLSQLQ
ncbi:DMT family transporter [Flavobacterium sp. '19STA2R22 D10 B1']|uniref:DMT family transporter n=1 Tax=Flavobacterium aerium TaxID=3037261 RepID=UPI00278BDE5E|nr:DMT family transporter [Flavobacterium sp. '19STA2R22 D10 B1']